jgi:hypothetical protein
LNTNHGINADLGTNHGIAQAQGWGIFSFEKI